MSVIAINAQIAIGEGQPPSRIVPPRSSTPFNSRSLKITRCGVPELNSVESAPSSPHTLRANSITSVCMPRQIPK